MRATPVPIERLGLKESSLHALLRGSSVCIRVACFERLADEAFPNFIVG